MPKVTLRPQNIALDAPRKSNLLKFLQSAGIPVGSACGGQGLCASCKIMVLRGEDSLSAPTDREIELKERNQVPDQERISCQCSILGDLEITTSYW